MDTPILQVKNLNVALEGHEILKNISFSVRRGDTLAIIGPNGAGKTVLLKTILGLLTYQGEIHLDPSIKIGYVPQRINLDPFLRVTVYDLFNMKRRLLKLPQSKVSDAIDFIHFKTELLKKQLISLSGGDLQRALIVLALIGDPELLLFDEPTANVDIPGEKKIHESLHHLQDLKNVSVILVSHDLNIVHRHANQILCLNKEMICFGQTHEMLEPNILKQLFGDKILYHHIEHHPKEHENA